MIVKRYVDFRYYFRGSGATAPDGLWRWSSGLVGTGLFTGGLSGFPTPITAFPFNFSIVGADSATAYHWYLSQRTDSVSGQYITFTQPNAALSGTVRFALTALAVSDLGLASATANVSEDDLKTILTDCWLYCRRNSDGAIQAFDLLKETLA